MPRPVRAVPILLALAALLAGDSSADGSRTVPGPPTSAAHSVSEPPDSSSRGRVGWRRGLAGWSRVGVPWPSFGPRRWSGSPPSAPATLREGDRADDWIGTPADRPTTVEPDGTPALLVVLLEPRSASLYVDDVWVGRASDLALPDARLEVPPGRHRLVASAPDHAPRVLTLELGPAEERRIEIRLEGPARSRP